MGRCAIHNDTVEVVELSIPEGGLCQLCINVGRCLLVQTLPGLEWVHKGRSALRLFGLIDIGYSLFLLGLVLGPLRSSYYLLIHLFSAVF